MKTLLITIFSFQFLLSFAQDGHFCAQDSIEQKGTMYLNEKGVINMKKTGGKNYWSYGQYSFSIVSDSLKDAYMIILEYDLTEPENGEYEKLGEFKCHELHAPSTQKDVTKKGFMVEAWAFYKNIEVWYNGEKLILRFPEIKNRNHISLSKDIYIPKDCIKQCLSTFKFK